METYKIGQIIRTGSYSGSGKWTKSIDTTAAEMQKLNAAGFYGIEKNDAPRGGVAGKHIIVKGRFLKTKKAIEKKVAKAIKVAAKGDPLYQGCGVYRVAVDENNQIVASLYGGFHGSNNYLNIKQADWKAAAEKLLSKYGRIFKVDGSGTKFFFRENPGFKTKIYTVPSAHGGLHVNFEHIEK